MKKLIKEFGAKSITDLKSEVSKVRNELAKLLIERGVKPEKDSNVISKNKRKLAVMLTLIHQKEFEEAKK
ncbi:hypothetical protein COV58_00285 [Candidatus Roizmanbacteria bacterium CG11_big_fil_rev_8_21_14_0_20_36_8]|uniref:Large ribosomal subunit protein uL29 n=2 Tax=Candidatus Roizmaniibacteriota TaxID=1752723 RepID=A0A2M6IVC0_9BACT|nr:MAG: hypothetical protein COV58_00285 [Candidatus Roizmanbacteria bacterium CG11_big_fil_rev_8_21_14_0_20_36_8]PIZ64881.1 MAG: hypothetical protein COY14_03570 [Candidatus Roizmanbacteria bacterium CG_4_10_14_0_2_um_filter_36_9]